MNSATKNTDNYDLVPKDHKVMVSYRGVFKSVTSEYLLNWIERFYSSQELHPNIKLKVLFRVSVELIQNLIHHSKNSDSFFFVSRSDNGDTCVVGTSNPVTNDQATILSSTLTTKLARRENRIEPRQERSTSQLMGNYNPLNQ